MCPYLCNTNNYVFITIAKELAHTASRLYMAKHQFVKHASKTTAGCNVYTYSYVHLLINL